MAAMVVMIPGFTTASVIAGLRFGAVEIGFAFQDNFENFLAGVLITMREKIRIGEVTLVPESMLFKKPGSDPDR